MAQPQAPQPPAPPPDPLQQIEAQIQTLQAQPTWEDAIQLLREDGQRGFRVDIETDSTISGDQAADQQAITELLTGITSFWKGIAPALEAGYITVDAVKSLTLAAVRRFKLGKVVEDTIDQLGAGQNQKPDQPDPKLLEMQFKMANLDFQRQQAQMDYAAKQRQMALDERSMALKEQETAARLKTESQNSALTHIRETGKLDLERAEHAHNVQHDRAAHNLEVAKEIRGAVEGQQDRTIQAAQP